MYHQLTGSCITAPCRPRLVPRAAVRISYGRIRIRQIVQELFSLPPLTEVYGMDQRWPSIPHPAQVDPQNCNFLFRLRHSGTRVVVTGANPARWPFPQEKATFCNLWETTFTLVSLQSRNNCRDFIEYLVPALQLTAFFCALHGFVSNQGELRLAVSKILKENHIVRIVHGLMFYPILRSLNLVSLRVSKVHRVNNLLVHNNLEVLAASPHLLPIRRSHAK